MRHGKNDMKKAALLLGTLALVFPVPIVSSYGPPSVDPRQVFEVSLADDYLMHLSPRSHFLLAPRQSVYNFDGFQLLNSESFTLSLRGDDWISLPSLGIVFICGPSN